MVIASSCVDEAQPLDCIDRDAKKRERMHNDNMTKHEVSGTKQVDDDCAGLTQSQRGFRLRWKQIASEVAASRSEMVRLGRRHVVIGAPGRWASRTKVKTRSKRDPVA